MKEGSHQLIERGQDALHDLQIQAEESLAEWRERATQAGERVAQRVRARPYRAVAIAAAIGFLGARLLLPRRRH